MANVNPKSSSYKRGAPAKTYVSKIPTLKQKKSKGTSDAERRAAVQKSIESSVSSVDQTTPADPNNEIASTSFSSSQQEAEVSSEKEVGVVEFADFSTMTDFKDKYLGTIRENSPILCGPPYKYFKFIDQMDPRLIKQLNLYEEKRRAATIFKYRRPKIHVAPSVKIEKTEELKPLSFRKRLVSRIGKISLRTVAVFLSVFIIVLVIGLLYQNDAISFKNPFAKPPPPPKSKPPFLLRPIIYAVKSVAKSIAHYFKDEQ